MMSEAELLQSIVSEYQSLLHPAKSQGSEPPEMDGIVHELSRSHDWTEQGAQAIATLASDYGAFMLRNALALAIAINREDGDLAF